MAGRSHGEPLLEDVVVAADMRFLGEDAERDPEGTKLWEKCSGLLLTSWYDAFKPSQACRLSVMDRALTIDGSKQKKAGTLYKIGRAVTSFIALFSSKVRQTAHFIKTGTARLMWSLAREIGKTKMPPTRFNLGTATNQIIAKHPHWLEPVADLMFFSKHLEDI